MAVLKFGYKLTREFARRMPCYEGEYTPNHPVFAEGSDALCKSDIKSVSVDAPRLKYTAADDKALEEYIRKFGENSNLSIRYGMYADHEPLPVVTAWHFVSEQVPQETA